MLDSGLYGHNDGLVHLVANYCTDLCLADSSCHVSQLLFLLFHQASRAFNSLSRRMVLTLAISFLTSRIRIGLSNCPVANWNRRLNNSLFNSVRDRKSTRLNSSHVRISYAVFTTHSFSFYELCFDGKFVSC